MDERSLRLSAALLLFLASAAAAGPAREASATAAHDGAGVPSLAAPVAGLAPLDASFTPSVAAPSLDAAASGPAAAEAAGAASASAAVAPSAAAASPGLLAERAPSAGGTKLDRALSRAKAAVAAWSRGSLGDADAAGAPGLGAVPLAKPTRSLRSTIAGALMAAGAFGASAPALAADGAPTKAAVADAQELLDAGQPGVQVYVVGHPRIKGGALDRIVAEVKGKPYVVVVVGNVGADGNVYKGKDGEAKTGIDAVEGAAHDVLLEKTGIGARRGSVISVVLDRVEGSQIGVVPSEQVVEAEDEELVPPGTADTLGAGDVAAAVRGVVAHVDADIERQKASWKGSAENALEQASSAVASVEAAWKAFAAAHPEADGRDVAGPSAELAAARALIQDDPQTAYHRLDALNRSANEYLEAIKAIPEAARRLQAARAKLAELRGESEASEFKGDLDAAEKLLNQASSMADHPSFAGATALSSAERRLELVQTRINSDTIMAWILGLLAAATLGVIGFVGYAIWRA